MLKNIPDILLSIFFKIRSQVMAGLLAVDVHFSFFIGVQPGNDIEQRGLAAAGLSGDHDELSFVQGQIDLGYTAGDHSFAVIKF